MNLSYPEWLLALCLWREARGEGDVGMRAVAHVIRNRVFRGKQDWIQIITAPNQFTSINPPNTKEGYPKDRQTESWPAGTDLLWFRAQDIAHQVYSGQESDITGGALYYANLEHIDQGGDFERRILGHPEKYPRTALIGAHTFFGEK